MSQKGKSCILVRMMIDRITILIILLMVDFCILVIHIYLLENLKKATDERNQQHQNVSI